MIRTLPNKFSNDAFSCRAGRKQARRLVSCPLLLSVVFIGVSGPAAAAVIADSYDDWSTSGTQGQRNWIHGYYNKTTDANGTYAMGDFVAFTNTAGPAGGPVSPTGNHWTGVQWDLTDAGNGPWTELGRDNTHPNGTNSAPGHEHWTIRRWTSDRAGDLLVRWNVAKSNTGCGSGVTGRLFQNGIQLDSQALSGSDGVTRTIVVTLAVGDRIDLAVTPVGSDGDPSDGCDGSVSRLTIETVSDSDSDGIADHLDNCPDASNASQADGDQDGIGDVCDNCPGAANAFQGDKDKDGIGNACDPDFSQEAGGESTSPVVIHEIFYNPPAAQAELEFLELHNPSADSIDLKGWSFADGIHYEFEAGDVLLPNGYFVLCRNPAALAAAHGLSGSSLRWWYESALDNGGEEVILLDAAGAVVDKVDYNDEVPWDPFADGSGASLQRLCATSDSQAPSNWRAGIGNAPTPLAANAASTCPPDPLPAPGIAIDEIHYHPTANADLTEEFVELVNATAGAIDLRDYCFTQGITFCFTQSRVLQPGEFLVVCRNEAAARNSFGIMNTIGDFTGQLSNNGERITLLDGQGQLVDSVRYGEKGDWGIGADGMGFSLEKIVPAAVSDDPASWMDSGAVESQPQSGWQSAAAQGVGTSSRLYIYVTEVSQFLVDDVLLENVANPGVNLIANGTFDTGISGWTPVGNHVNSRWSQALGGQIFPDKALHVVAEGQGTGSANSVYADTTAPLDTTGATTYRLTFSYQHVSGATGLISRLSVSTPSRGIYFQLGARSTVVSPGVANIVRLSAVPPFISGIQRSVREPGSGVPVTITAQVRGNPTQVRLTANLPGGAQVLTMRDDGLTGDGASGDGVYGVTIPGQVHNTVVTFKIEASSAQGSRASPLRSDPGELHGYYVNDNQPDSNIPVYTLLLPTTNPRQWVSGLACGTYQDSSFAYRGDLYYSTGIRARGASVCGSYKRFLKLAFNRGHEFRDVRRLNLQSLWTDKSLIRENMAWSLFDEMGSPNCFHDFVRIHANGAYFGLYAAYEHPDERFLERNELNPDGNLYKATASREETTGVYEKHTNEESGSADLTAFLNAMHSTASAGLASFFEQRTDPDLIIEYQMGQTLINNSDYPHKNHYLYHDTSTDRWIVTSWDIDLSFGKIWSGTYGGVLNDGMHNPGNTPWYTTNVRGEGTGNYLLDKFFSQAGTFFRRAYLVRLWGALHEKYTEDVYNAKIADLQDLIYEEQLDDIAAWGRSSPTANDPTAPADFESNLERVKQHIAIRRSYLINYLQTTESFSGNHDRVKITEVMYNPVGGRDYEFLELWNNSGHTVDLTGWVIEGLGELNPQGQMVEYTFPAGSTVAADEVFIVAKSTGFFASRYGTVGQVFGPYPGNLDNAGDILRVKDDGPGHRATVDFLWYDNKAPWPTKPDGLAHSLELFDITADLDNDVAYPWRSSLSEDGSPGSIHKLGDDTVMFRRGNCNADQVVDISDAVRILFYLFAGAGTPPCLDGCDINGNLSVGIEDAVALLNYLFRPGGFNIPAPSPTQCLPARVGFCDSSNCAGSA